MSTAVLRHVEREPIQRAPVRDVVLRPPRPADGPEVHALISRCNPLDENSLYCNLLQTTHFASTSVAAEGEEGGLVGFISGYLLPARDDTLFVWQVAVGEEARGLGLGKRMLRSILQRPVMREVRYLNTTVTPDNEASWRLFRSFARAVEAPLQSRVLFDCETHFGGSHDDEILIEIGSFDVRA